MVDEWREEGEGRGDAHEEMGDKNEGKTAKEMERLGEMISKGRKVWGSMDGGRGVCEWRCGEKGRVKGWGRRGDRC